MYDGSVRGTGKWERAIGYRIVKSALFPGEPELGSIHSAISHTPRSGMVHHEWLSNIPLRAGPMITEVSDL